MNSRLLHRGPDGGGVEGIDKVMFGHRRLSIIDLSPAGAQPKWDHAKRCLITFNGEIYNFAEIKKELTARGARFTSATDTEVILEAYKQWGVECIKRLNGMFAFALWDREQQTLLIARDRLGKKPLFYSVLKDGSLVFASELKALAEEPGLDAELNDQALLHYLKLGYVLTSQSILRGVKKLPPGHYLVVKNGKIGEPVSYWDLSASFRSKVYYRQESEALERFNELFDDAVRIRLMSDVPLGAFLSGGLDSSSVVASMCRARTADKNHTFSVGFREETFSELEEARVVARHLGVSHHDQFVEKNAVQHLASIVNACDEVFADTSMIPMYFLSEFTRKFVTVALSGDGADEILAGYETYAADKFYQFVHRLPSGVIDIAEWLYRTLRPRDFGKVSTDYKILHFLRGVRFPFVRAHYSWRELFTNEELRGLLLPEHHGLISQADPFGDFERFAADLPDAHYLDRAMYVDIKTWLPDDILVKVDRTTMAHSLEARAPFLDYRLVEFAAGLPVNLKLKGLSKKYILKKSQEKILPRSTLSRKKAGFNSPIAEWLKSSLKMHCEDLIKESPLHAYVAPAAIRKLYDEHLAGKSDNSHKLFVLINFHLWSEGRRAVKRAAA